MIEFIDTESGHRLGIGRIDRREIDRFAGENPPPEPPMQSAAELGIEIFGGFEEEELIPNWEDSSYLEAAAFYSLTFWNKRIELLFPAVTRLTELTESNQVEIADLRELGVIIETELDILRFIILRSEQDISLVVMAVKYNSTVTMAGIRNAAKRFAVTWDKRPVAVEAPDRSLLFAGHEFSDRRTARYVGLTWDRFCDLPGPEQSAFAAFHRLNTRLENIQARAWRR